MQSFFAVVFRGARNVERLHSQEYAAFGGLINIRAQELSTGIGLVWNIDAWSWWWLSCSRGGRRIKRVARPGIRRIEWPAILRRIAGRQGSGRPVCTQSRNDVARPDERLTQQVPIRTYAFLAHPLGGKFELPLEVRAHSMRAVESIEVSMRQLDITAAEAVECISEVGKHLFSPNDIRLFR